MSNTAATNRLRALSQFFSPRLNVAQEGHEQVIFDKKPTNNTMTSSIVTDTGKYKLNHSMIRVKDPKASIKFYEFLGMTVVKKLEFPDNKFDLYFLGFDAPGAASHGKSTFDRQGLVELTHNYGTEHDPEYKVNNGNMELHNGFSYICLSVDSLEAACQRLEDEGYKFQQRLSDATSKKFATVMDPDGYWVRLISQYRGTAQEATSTDVSSYRMNHTMLRVKDAKKSIDYYEKILGLALLKTIEDSDRGCSLFLLGYSSSVNIPTDNNIGGCEGLLGLMWEHGTENRSDFRYHNGNEQPQGFGHLCISVDHLGSACQRFESLGVEWKKRLTEGRMKNVAFLLDPDGYWIEVVQNEAFTGVENF
ncbi:hypothetical protein CEP54_013818 [Fusarium duplospermum]|uniref:Aldoketomutase n=1 Tax=Fusarium duplospermum TaxID=1325734 RepID=A0A428P077_9HYPO|nr:hypothetical protein CEP54_013818 [Fusarium duplospermum]